MAPALHSLQPLSNLFLLESLDHISRDFFHVKCLEFRKRARHVEQREVDLAVHLHFERSLARFLSVDGNCGSRKGSLHESFELCRPRLECASGFASLDLDTCTTTRCRSSLGRRCLFLSGGFVNGLLGRHVGRPECGRLTIDAGSANFREIGSEIAIPEPRGSPWECVVLVPVERRS